MSTIKSWARKGLSLATAAGLTATMIMALPMSASAAATTITFEDSDTLGASASAFEGGVAVAATPGVSNSSGEALEFTKSGAPWSGFQIAAPTNSGFTSSANKTISFDYYSPDTVNTPVMLKLETAGGASYVRKTFSAAPGWANYSVDLSTITGAGGTWSSSNTYVNLVMFPNFTNDDVAIDGVTASAVEGKKYYIDNISVEVVSLTPPPPPLTNPYKLTFEDSDSVGSQAYGDPTAEKPAGQFEGGGTGQATPPVARSGKALEFNKAVAGQDYSGFLAFVAPDGERITSDTFKTISFDYYSPDAVASPVTMQLERTSEPNYGEFAVKKTFVANQGWNTFTVDVSTMANYAADRTLVKLIFFPNFGTADGATVAAKGQKYYFDNIVFNGWGKAVRTAANTISGTAKSGKTLTASTGTWTGNGVTYSYQWYRCTKSSGSTKLSSPSSSDKCSALRGKTAATYKLTSSDRGKYIRVRVKATTSAGDVFSTSKSTSRVR